MYQNHLWHFIKSYKWIVKVWWVFIKKKIQWFYIYDKISRHTKKTQEDVKFFSVRTYVNELWCFFFVFRQSLITFCNIKKNYLTKRRDTKKLLKHLFFYVFSFYIHNVDWKALILKKMKPMTKSPTYDDVLNFKIKLYILNIF